MTERVDAVVVGAGVVGLAVGRALALTGREVVVLEREGAIGTQTSSRNSEVIHAGLYYPGGSLKARLCVAGREALYAYADARGFTAVPVGKLLVAADARQLPALDAIRAAGARNGVEGLAVLTAGEARAFEPDVTCAGALFSPVSGILDSHAFMLALQGDLENAGGVVALRSPVTGGRSGGSGGVTLEVGGPEGMALSAPVVVNAAGLGAMQLAGAIAGMPASKVPALRLAKGSYFSLTGVKAPFRHLVYPMPEPGGLGVHATIDLGGQVRFGPDVEWTDHIDYAVEPERAQHFYAAIRTYWPGLPDGALLPAYSGIRPKLTGPGAAAADFMIQGPAEHGVPGLWNLFGIESPGLTAALALADVVVRRL